MFRRSHPTPPRLPAVPPELRVWRLPAIASQPYTSRRLAYAALLVAAGLTGAYAESVPNFELLTLVAFASGVLLGARDGMLVSGLMMLLFTLLNPYGPAPPAVMLAQILGMSLAGAAGALFARLGGHHWPIPRRVLALATLAVVVTAAYDLLTNVATGLVFGQMRYWLLAGIPFSLWHIGFNVALFSAVGSPLTAVLARYAERLSVSS
jgi:ABC-type Fe3+-siderophore transport system permease subunit